MKTLLGFLLTITLGIGMAKGQEMPQVTHTFTSLEEVIAYSENTSLDLVINNIRIEQATRQKKAAGVEIFDPTITLPASFTHFTNQPVTLLPAEVFGGEPGTTVELEAGVPYTTEFSQNLQVHLINPTGWADFKLAKINEEMSKNNGLLTRQVLQENIADSYYAIVTLNKQRESTEALLKSADSVYVITQNKYNEGLVSQQDLNNAQVNKLNTEKSLRHIEYLLVDSYLTLKILCTIPEEEQVVIDHRAPVAIALMEPPVVEINQLDLKYEFLNQDYALQNYKKSKSLLLPSLSFIAGNSYQLNNTTFQPLSGNWVNSNYVGLTLSFTLPSASTVSNMQRARLDYQIATREVEKAEHASIVEKKKLENNYDEALAEYNLSQEIWQLNTDTYERNINLYTQGLISVDDLLNSYEAMLNAEYTANSAAISLELAHAKILINNTFK